MEAPTMDERKPEVENVVLRYTEIKSMIAAQISLTREQMVSIRNLNAQGGFFGWRFAMTVWEGTDESLLCRS